LGSGQAIFEQAKVAIRHWQMFDLVGYNCAGRRRQSLSAQQWACWLTCLGFWFTQCLSLFVYLIDETIEENGVPSNGTALPMARCRIMLERERSDLWSSAAGGRHGIVVTFWLFRTRSMVG